MIRACCCILDSRVVAQMKSFPADLAIRSLSENEACARPMIQAFRTFDASTRWLTGVEEKEILRTKTAGGGWRGQPKRRRAIAASAGRRPISSGLDMAPSTGRRSVPSQGMMILHANRNSALPWPWRPSHRRHFFRIAARSIHRDVRNHASGFPYFGVLLDDTLR